MEHEKRIQIFANSFDAFDMQDGRKDRLLNAGSNLACRAANLDAPLRLRFKLEEFARHRQRLVEAEACSGGTKLPSASGL